MKSKNRRDWEGIIEKFLSEQNRKSGFELTLPTLISNAATRNFKMKKHILNLISDGKLKEALDIMREIEDTQSKYFKDPLIGCLSRYNRNERDKNNGMLDSRDYKIEYNRIEAAVKSLLDSELDESRIPADVRSVILKAGVRQPDTDDKMLKSIEAKDVTALRILMLTANPAETTKLNLNKEHSKITVKLQDQPDRFELKRKDAVDKTAFKEETELYQPDIIHFSGHGEKGGDYGGIVLQNEDRNGYEMLSASKLDALFEYFKDEFSMKAVVLNACFSQDQAEVIARHVPYVVGATVRVVDEQAIAFSTGFYFKLVSVNNLDFERAFKSGRMEAISAGAQKQDFVLYKNGAILAI